MSIKPYHPDGKTCADCKHCTKYCWAFGVQPEQGFRTCLWEPSRFKQKGGRQS